MYKKNPSGKRISMAPLTDWGCLPCEYSIKRW